MITSVFKSAVWSIVGNLIKETALALFMKLKWKVLLERALSRVLVYCLVKLRSLSTNELWQAQLDDFIKVLTNPSMKLPKIEEQYKRMTDAAVENIS